MNRREFLRGAIATAAAAGLPISGAIALADAIKPKGTPIALVPHDLQFGPDSAAYGVTTVEKLRAYIESLLSLRPYNAIAYDDYEPMIGFGIATKAPVDRWTGNVFALGWNETDEAIEDGRYDEQKMIGNVCRCHAIGVSEWINKEGLRGHKAVWRQPIAHRTDREFESGAIKHIISFRLAVKA